MAISPFIQNFPKSKGNNKFNFQPATRTPTDIVKLGDFTFPGISKVDVTRARKAKVQTKKKGKGDRLVDSGLELANIKITTRIFFDEEYNEIERILDFFENKVGLGNSNTANSFAINNPSTRQRRVFIVFVESIEGPYNYMPPGYTEYIFNCKEVVKPKDQKPKTEKPAPQKPIETSTALNADFSNNLPPSQDPANIQPRRGL